MFHFVSICMCARGFMWCILAQKYGPEQLVAVICCIPADGSALSRTGSVPYNFLYCQLSQRCVQQQQQQQQQCRVNNNILSHPNRRRHSVSGSSNSQHSAQHCVVLLHCIILLHWSNTGSYQIAPLVLLFQLK